MTFECEACGTVNCRRSHLYQSTDPAINAGNEKIVLALKARLTALEDEHRRFLLRLVSTWDVWRRISPEGIVDAKDNLFAVIDDARTALLTNQGDANNE